MVSQLFLNFKEIFSKRNYLFFFVGVMVFVLSIFNLFTEDELIIGNLGYVYFYVNLVMQYLISILFASFLTSFVYKYVKFSSFDSKNSSISIFGTFMGIIVAGCPACSFSIAAYIGLGSVVAFLPYAGLELKIIAIPMLLYANYSSLRDLNVCKIKFKNK